MKKVLIIGVVLVMIVGAAGGYWFLLRDDEAATNANNTAQSTENTEQFNPVATTDVPMIATITTEADGEKNVMVMKFDGKGNSEYTTEQNGEEVRFVITEDTYYMCNMSGCFKYANTQEQAGATDPAQYEQSQEDIDKFRANATKKGTESCGTSTCEVWEVSNYSENGSATFFVDTSSKRIVKIESAFNGSTSVIEYDYTDVTIEIPTTAEELPSGI